MSSISSITSGTNTNTATQPTAPPQTLTEGDFLNLLVTQMTSQDPLDPQSDTEMAAQMAQFASLQNSVSLNTNMTGLQANQLLGRTVSVSGSNGGSITGVVSSVQLQAGTPEIVVNGTPYAMSALTGITPTTTTPATN